VTQLQGVRALGDVGEHVLRARPTFVGTASPSRCGA
jgi:hypothetical protein